MLKFLVVPDPTDFFKKEESLSMLKTIYLLGEHILNIQILRSNQNTKIKKN
jgi:hypothetical protein